MRGIRRWLGIARGPDPREGDPYLESLARYLLLLNSGQAPRKPILPRSMRGIR